MENKKEVRPINWLSVIRVIATIMIVTVHFGQSLPLPQIISLPISYCQTAVCIFFILTGYMSQKSLSNNGDAKCFYKKRAIRILPVFYCVIIVNILASVLIGNYPKDSLHLGWLRFFSFTNSIIPSNDYRYWNNGAALWTMSGFCVFYVFAPFIAKIMKRPRYSFLFLMGGVLVSIISEKMLAHIASGSGIYAESLEYLSTHSVFFVFYEMVLGMYIYEAKKSKVISIVPLVIIGLYGRIYKNYWMLDTAIYSFIIFFLSNKSNTELESLKPCVKKIIAKLDEYSYSIYLGHTTVMFIFSRLQERIGFSNTALGLFDFIGCIVFVPLLHLIVEKSLGSKLASRAGT